MNKIFKKARTRDNAPVGLVGMPNDQNLSWRTIDAAGNMEGKKLPYAFTTHDGRTTDSTGAFLVGELERLDPTLHMPLASVTWARDIDLREDVSIANDATSFTVSTFASSGSFDSTPGGGKSWTGRKANQAVSNSVDIAKIATPLTPWDLEIKYTYFDLASAIQTGRPLDQQLLDNLHLKHQMDIDAQVYVGDSTLSIPGLVNHPLVAKYGIVSSLPNGASGSSLWESKTADEILLDFNTMLTDVWTQSAYAVIPSSILLPPVQFGFLTSKKVSEAGNVSVLKYILENNIAMTSRGIMLNIQPVKWLQGTDSQLTGLLGNGNSNRAVVYTKAKDRVRLPLTPLDRTPVQFDSIYHKATYFCKIGGVEVVYPETIGYFDGL